MGMAAKFACTLLVNVWVYVWRDNQRPTTSSSPCLCSARWSWENCTPFSIDAVVRSGRIKEPNHPLPFIPARVMPITVLVFSNFPSMHFTRINQRCIMAIWPMLRYFHYTFFIFDLNGRHCAMAAPEFATAMRCENGNNQVVGGCLTWACCSKINNRIEMNGGVWGHNNYANGNAVCINENKANFWLVNYNFLREDLADYCRRAVAGH